MSSSGAGAQPFASSITVDGGVTTTDKVAVTVAPALAAVVPGAAAPAAAPEVGSKRNPITPEMLELVAKVDNEKGLNAEAVAALTAKWGANVLPSKSRSKFLIFLSFLYGPMPIAIEIAALIELIQSAITSQGWEDFGILVFLLLLNAIIGFVEEVKAGNAVEALKSKLAAKANVLRDGGWHELPASVLVPGDLIDLKLGDAIPADCIMQGGNPVEVDQSGLTGESLPVEVKSGGYLMQGSMLKTGQIKAVVVATGTNTSYGEAAKLIASVNEVGHLRHVINSIVIVMLSLCVVICACIFARIMALPAANPAAMFSSGSQGLQALSIVVVILVASIPVAIEVVSTSTLAVGAHTMANKQVIVARLNAIEELAGMTVLCSDKTGTLTLNQLSLDDALVRAFPPEDAAALAAASGGDLAPARGEAAPFGATHVKLCAALASRRDGKPDAIDLCIVGALDAAGAARAATWREAYAIPFDPITKRTIVTVERAADGLRLRVCKGAPQKVLEICSNKAAIAPEVTRVVGELASRGYRALGVAVCARPAAGESTLNGAVEGERWLYIGIVPLFDPPRKDTRRTIEQAVANGIEVKMITGDQTAIAKETCRQLGMGANILEAHVLDTTDPTQLAAVDAVIMEAHGFAEVLPKHKFQIVERIRQMGHITGMTGDGVNDAPALKRADIGIAVHGATDAAKAAASIVLTEPGLSVIIDAIYESRKIFQRMRSYFIYRITCTVQILAFFFFIITCAQLDDSYFYRGVFAPQPQMAHPQVFSLPVLALVFLTLINDGACIAVSSDTIPASSTPQIWAVAEMWIVSTAMGLLLAFSTLILCVALMQANFLNPGLFMGVLFGSSGRNYVLYPEAASVVFLQISVSNMMTLVAARERGAWSSSLVSWQLGVSMGAAFVVSTLLSLFWSQMFVTNEQSNPNSGMASLCYSPGAVVCTFIYCILWFCIQDVVKQGVYWLCGKCLKHAGSSVVENHAKDHAPEALAEASHPLQGADEVAARAQRNGPVASSVLATTAQGTVAVRTVASVGGPRGTLANLFSPGRPVPPARLSKASLPNGVDLTALVLNASSTVGSRSTAVHRLPTAHA